MENIARRAVVVLTILGLAGLPASFLFIKEGDNFLNLREIEMDKRFSEELEGCLDVAIALDNADAVDRCYKDHGPDLDRANRWLDAADRAFERAQATQIVGIGFPIVIWGIFFTLRWILTGRWSRR